ncbi:hypothetical protein FJZ33_08830, partial [Candidatus Poribacteria bacterium]|nr:hypothetical protein [Candidatus Poribacteria bacterium]
MKLQNKGLVSVSNSLWKRSRFLYIFIIFFMFIYGCATGIPQPGIPDISPVHSKNIPRLIGLNYQYTIKGNFSRPTGLDIDTEGNIYVADSGKSVIHILDKDGKTLESLGRFGWRSGEFDNPWDVSVDSHLRLFIADSGNNRIQVYSLINRVFSVIMGESVGSIMLSQPQGVACNNRGFIYIADTWNNRILKADSSGRLKIELDGQQIKTPSYLAVDSKDNIYVSNFGNHNICKLDFSGNVAAVFGEEGVSKGKFQNPSGLALDKFGYLYVVDRGNRRVQVFNPEGIFITESGQSLLEDPVDIAIDN